VDHEDQIVQMLARSDVNGAQRLRLVGFAVAEEAPHLAPGGLGETAVFQILHETRLVDGSDRPQAHAYRSELPEIRHQPWVRVRRQPVALAVLELLAEITHLLLGDTAFEESARIKTFGRMALEIHQISAVAIRRPMKEV